MDPNRKNRELLVANEELSSIRNNQTSTQARPMLTKGPRKPVRDDIDKLFEAMNIRTSKSLDLSDHAGLTRKNASKRPMRIVPSYSHGIGFSEPVSLKQALRGLCISQAGEVAAKRLLKSPGSPSMHRPIVVETVQSGIPLMESMFEISLVPEESSPISLDTTHENLKNPKDLLGNQSFHSSPDSVIIKPDMKTLESSIEHKVNPSTSSKVPNQTFETKDSSRSENDGLPAFEVEMQSLEPPEATQMEKQTLNSALLDQSVNYYDSSKLNDSIVSSSISPKKKVRNFTKTNQKLRQKTKLPTISSSIAVKISKEKKPIRSTPRAMKPLTRNKNQEQVINISNSQTLSEAIGSSDYSSNQLICHNCQCSLKDITKEPYKNFTEPFNNTVMTVSKAKQKGEFTQSSKSSIGEFSTSTSTSDDSNATRSSCGNRPHMSKDFKWEAISNVKKQHGILGLRHFNLLKKLGSGDIGTVYLAELVGTNCPFAIKVMDNEFLARRKKTPRARTEREILRMLDHPFLPTLYAQFTSGSLSCLVMEFCPGGDLHVLRQKQPGRCFPEQEARFYVAEVLLALEYLHMLGIVYRDLKPENILVREDGHIMLTDFDLSLRCSVNPTLLKSSSSLGIEPPRISGPCAGSKCIDPFCAGPSCKVSCFTPRIFPTASARTRKHKAGQEAARTESLPQLVAEPTEARSNSFVGTHEYLAPEIIKGEGHGSAVDWWTLGIFLYELLFGKTPFRGPGNEETLANVVFENLRFPNTPMISFQARDLIRGLLVKEPENRFGTETGAAEIKRHPFFNGLNWALIRCATPPQIPDLCDIQVPNVTLQEMGKSFMECSAIGDHLEFELF